MISRTSISALIFIIGSVASGCQGKGNAGNNSGAANTLAPTSGVTEKYTVAGQKESIVAWKGSMLGGTNPHTGYVYVSKGELLVDNKAIVGGSIDVDMKTIEDINHDSNNNLIDHLKNADFFDVTKFPVSTIAITKAEPLTAGKQNLTASLTIKGITHPVSFPAAVDVNNGVLNASARLMIDRTQWDIRYKSAKFFALVADQTMSDSIAFHIKIVAKK